MSAIARLQNFCHWHVLFLHPQHILAKGARNRVRWMVSFERAKETMTTEGSQTNGKKKDAFKRRYQGFVIATGDTQATHKPGP